MKQKKYDALRRIRTILVVSCGMGLYLESDEIDEIALILYQNGIRPRNGK